MISGAVTEVEQRWCRDFLAQRGQIGVSPSAHLLMFRHEGELPSWVVAFDEWVGSTCHLTMASNGRTPMPRSLARAVFLYGFSIIHRSHMFCVVNSRNVRSERIIRFVGFKEVYRVAGAHEEGGDLVFFQITPADWAKREFRYGKKEHSTLS